jgi:hypothetical protein
MITLDALIVPAEQAAQIDLINAEDPSRQLQPVLALDGRKVLPAALLTDCGPGQTWAAYHDILTVLDREIVPMPDSSSGA